MKVTAALALMTGISSPSGTPAGLNRQPTMSMMNAAHVVENKKSFLRPTRSMMNDPGHQHVYVMPEHDSPVKAPTMETAAFTRFNSRCLSLSTMPAKVSSTGKKSNY